MPNTEYSVNNEQIDNIKVHFSSWIKNTGSIIHLVKYTRLFTDGTELFRPQWTMLLMGIFFLPVPVSSLLLYQNTWINA